MCTIISKDQFIGKNLDSIVDSGMMFTNKRGLIKKAAVFPPDRPLEWVSYYGSITFCLSGKEMPACGINEAGLVVEQATLPAAVYPCQEGKPAAGILEATQFLLDTCRSVEQALAALDSIAITESSWPVHFMLFDAGGTMAAVEYLQGEKHIHEGTTEKARRMDNCEYRHSEVPLDCRSVDDMFSALEETRRPDTVWSHVYDLNKRTLHLKRAGKEEMFLVETDRLDLSPRSTELMLNLKEGDDCLEPFCTLRNRHLISEFFNHPVIRQIMQLPDPEAMIDFIAELPKNYDRVNKIMLRFLDGERISQIPVKASHKKYVLMYLASRFETGKDYTEAQVNALIDRWHTFGDYFILRRELADCGLLKRLPNGSKYWREIV